eukprot:COSAG06_NODE_41010_length_396_cov_0.700337_1_plen_45_part_10
MTTTPRQRYYPPAHIFRTLEERAAELNIADYSVAQPTMEQIFLGF